MNYNQALEFIHSSSNYFCKPGLDRIKRLCDSLGNPQDSLKFIHVAGTNGKGSFCAMLSSVLQNAGYKVGRYTSPYILDFNERIAVNGCPISNSDLCALCDKIKPYCDNTEDSPTEFEVITALGFEHFKNEKCDIVILECGMGGKFDATNIIKTPILSVITGVDFDHQNFLGDTIEQIAQEKTGIIKQNVPCIWCGDNIAAENIIKNTAKENNAPLYTPEKDKLQINSLDLSGTSFNYGEFKNVEISLLGNYQPLNAANVLTACSILNNSGFTVERNSIYNGLRNVTWHARFEKLGENPLIIFDGAHNPQGIRASVDSIKMYFGNKKVNILSGVMADKDYNFMVRAIGEVANNIYCVTPDNPRALKSNKYCDTFKNLGFNSFFFDSIEDGLMKAMNDSKKSGVPLIILGSLYLYSDIYKILKNQ